MSVCREGCGVSEEMVLGQQVILCSATREQGRKPLRCVGLLIVEVPWYFLVRVEA